MCGCVVAAGAVLDLDRRVRDPEILPELPLDVADRDRGVRVLRDARVQRNLFASTQCSGARFSRIATVPMYSPETLATCSFSPIS